MGLITNNYKKSLYDEMLSNIASNTSTYYVFGSNPVKPSNNATNSYIEKSDIKDVNFLFTWNILFGKSLSANNFSKIILNNTWSSNTVYNRYDDSIENLNNFYIVTPPITVGADRFVYKCIDNANNSPSLIVPNQVQSNTFYTSDNYAWRYMYTISDADYNKYATNFYVPVFTNTVISSFASNNSGIDVVKISNTGINYNSYHDGIVQSVNSNIIQISSNASFFNNYYNNNGIYLYAVNNTAPTTSQLLTVNNYVSNSSGNWIYTKESINTNNILVGKTLYKISPKVVFQTDGDSQPQAYSIINVNGNTISNVVIINTGSNISWANASISSNTSYGNGCILSPIVAPPGGHGANPAVELNIQGYIISFKFDNLETSSLPVDITYNKIGIIKNPYVMGVNETKSSNLYNSAFFNQMLTANCLTTFTIGDKVIGNTSNAIATVVYSNNNILYLSGDMYFINNEYISSLNNSAKNGILKINTTGSIYVKDLYPLYIRNINNITRSNTQSEAFKLVIQL